MATATALTSIPEGFWPQIDHQIRRISTTQPDTFDAVREILTDPSYDEITAEINRNGDRRFDKNAAFFAGSGGDSTLYAALERAGWRIRAYEASYHYVLFHTSSGETLTYTEGDITRGDALSGQ